MCEDGEGFGDVYPILSPAVSPCRGRLVSSEAGSLGELLQGGQGNQPWGTQVGVGCGEVLASIPQWLREWL